MIGLWFIWPSAKVNGETFTNYIVLWNMRALGPSTHVSMWESGSALTSVLDHGRLAVIDEEIE